MKVVCETRDWDHSEEFKKIIKQKYEHASFNDVSMRVPQWVSHAMQ